MFGLLLFRFVMYLMMDGLSAKDAAGYTFVTLFTVGYGEFPLVMPFSKIVSTVFIAGFVALAIYLAYLLFSTYRFHKEKPEHWIEIRHNGRHAGK